MLTQPSRPAAILRTGIFAIGMAAGIGIINSGEASALSPSITINNNQPIADCTGNVIVGEGKNGIGRCEVSFPINFSSARNYSIYLSSTDSDTSLTGANGGSISTFTGSKSVTDFENSSTSIWGYRAHYGTGTATMPDEIKGINPLDSKTTLPIVDNQSLPATDPNSNGNLTLQFLTSVTGDTPSDSYSKSILVSAIASPAQFTLFDIVYMQQMDSDVCIFTPTPSPSATAFATNLEDITVGVNGGNLIPEKTLIDKRDNRTYLVRKLADGNCWMSQNLELDFLGNSLTGQQDSTKQAYATAPTYDKDTATFADTQVSGVFKLTDADTDLHSDGLGNPLAEWTPSYASSAYGLQTFATLVHQQYEYNSDIPYFWAENGDDGLRSYSYAGSWSDGAENYSVVDVAGNNTTATTFKSSPTGQPYQRKGNLYNWTAATLGSGKNLTENGDDAPNSICPKGWQLPAGTNPADTFSATALPNVTNKSFAKLLRTYKNDATNLNNNNFVWSGTVSAIDYNFAIGEPLSFSPTGYYNQYGYIYGRLNSAAWWTNMAVSASEARSLAVYEDLSNYGALNVDADHNHMRGHGFPIRCVAR